MSADSGMRPGVPATASDPTAVSDDNRYGPMGTRTLTAFFDDHDDAEDAVRRLRDAGVAEGNLRLIAGSEPASRAVRDEDEDRGFFAALRDFFMPDEDRHSYAEGLRRGGYLVTVTGVDDRLHSTVLDILDDEGTVDMDERERTWREEGWRGYDASAGMPPQEPASTLGQTPGTGAAASTPSPGRMVGAERGGLETDDRFARGERGADEVLPVADEQLQVGKRDVSHGRVRVRSYVVETPVQEQLSLREEHVRVERRPVDRPLDGSEDPFRERTIEAEERAEEAVVSKEARVREEVALRREQERRDETISDTVRRTEVEVEDERTAKRDDRLPGAGRRA